MGFKPNSTTIFDQRAHVERQRVWLPLREDEMGETLWRAELVWVLEKMGG